MLGLCRGSWNITAYCYPFIEWIAMLLIPPAAVSTLISHRCPSFLALVQTLPIAMQAAASERVNAAIQRSAATVLSEAPEDLVDRMLVADTARDPRRVSAAGEDSGNANDPVPGFRVLQLFWHNDLPHSKFKRRLEPILDIFVSCQLENIREFIREANMSCFSVGTVLGPLFSTRGTSSGPPVEGAEDAGSVDASSLSSISSKGGVAAQEPPTAVLKNTVSSALDNLPCLFRHLISQNHRFPPSTVRELYACCLRNLDSPKQWRALKPALLEVLAACSHHDDDQSALPAQLLQQTLAFEGIQKDATMLVGTEKHLAETILTLAEAVGLGTSGGDKALFAIDASGATNADHSLTIDFAAGCSWGGYTYTHPWLPAYLRFVVVHNLKEFANDFLPSTNAARSLGASGVGGRQKRNPKKTIPQKLTAEASYFFRVTVSQLSLLHLTCLLNSVGVREFLGNLSKLDDTVLSRRFLATDLPALASAVQKILRNCAGLEVLCDDIARLRGVVEENHVSF